MSGRPKIPQELMEYIELVIPVASKRAKYVLDKLIIKGFITSQELRDEGYIHGARAIGDVRDNGIPLVTLDAKSEDGRSIARYELGPVSEIKRNKLGGRKAFPTSLKKILIDRDGPFCAISEQELPVDQLQVDHKIPFYLTGDISTARDPADFMLLSRSMQRSKSWACENCDNLKRVFDIRICSTCYWAFPNAYEHIAMKEERRVDVVFTNEEVRIIDRLRDAAQNDGVSIQATIKNILARFVGL
jgi:hypothetical protein